MTFSSYTYAIDGGNQSGQLWRLALEGATSESLGGVIGPLDCLVTATSVPSLGVNVGDGKFIVNGQEIADQGTYYGFNQGSDTSLNGVISPTGGSPRSDMIVIRAEDPTFSGSPWSGSVTAQTIFPRVISGVSGTATQPPGGQSCIPLARIDLPAGVSSVLQGYITDLRAVANPKRARAVLTAQGGSATSWTVGTSPTAWPPTATWSVNVPVWATWVKMNWKISGALYLGGGNGTAGGSVGPVFGASVSAPNVSFPVTPVSFAFGSGSAEHLTFAVDGGVDTSVPASVRGTTQTLQFAQVTDGTNTALLQAGPGAYIVCDIEFHQTAVTS